MPHLHYNKAVQHYDKNTNNFYRIQTQEENPTLIVGSALHVVNNKCHLLVKKNVLFASVGNLFVDDTYCLYPKNLLYKGMPFQR